MFSRHTTRIFIALCAFGLIPSLARAGGYDSCIEKLSAGQNRYHISLPSSPLKRLASAMENGKSRLTQALLVDYTRSSRTKRAFLVDFKRCDILTEKYVIHGGTIYRNQGGTLVVAHRYGDTNHDGILDHCVRPNGSVKDMTRPGLFITNGCHTTSERNWTWITSRCQGVNLKSLDPYIRTSDIPGVVLHEHLGISDDNSLKPEGQGCPAFPPGELKSMVKYGIMNGMLVLVYAPQCSRQIMAFAHNRGNC